MVNFLYGFFFFGRIYKETNKKYFKEMIAFSSRKRYSILCTSVFTPGDYREEDEQKNSLVLFCLEKTFRVQILRK